MKRSAIASSLLLVLLIAPGAVAQPFSLDWFTIDGGGASATTGGAFELSGTVGQPDAGFASGGDFELIGGFWTVTTAPTLLPGDCDGDGDVDLSNYAGFPDCATGPDDGPPAAECACYDVNRDDAVDMLDFADIQIGFTG